MGQLLWFFALVLLFLPVIFQLWAVAKQVKLPIFGIAMISILLEVAAILLSIILACKALTVQGINCMTPLIGIPGIGGGAMLIILLIAILQCIFKKR